MKYQLTIVRVPEISEENPRSNRRNTGEYGMNSPQPYENVLTVELTEEQYRAVKEESIKVF